MTNSNRIKLTWISFLSYALTGALVIVTGMVMGNIADYFNLPVSSMSNTFTFLNAGILISIFLNAWLMEIVPLKTQLRFGFLLMVLAVAGLMFSHSLPDLQAASPDLQLLCRLPHQILSFYLRQVLRRSVLTILFSSVWLLQISLVSGISATYAYSKMKYTISCFICHAL